MMKAWRIERLDRIVRGVDPIRLAELPVPQPAAGEVLIRVHACGVCHTELDEIEGRTPPAQLPIIPGHQVVGTIEEEGSGSDGAMLGLRVGVAWINSTCGTCGYCTSGRENLCEHFKATGRDANGGYAEWMTAPAAFVHPLPENIPDEKAAPLLCSGAIGYRSLRLAGLQESGVLGLTGFGASGHQVLQLCRTLHARSTVMVFARRTAERELAMALGAAWAGDIGELPPVHCDAIIDTTPAWRPIVQALRALAPGGRLVINAIRKEATDQQELLGLDYPRDLWMEKEIKSVANITRADVREFLRIASQHDLLPQVTTYAFNDAPTALLDLKEGNGEGAKVLVMDHSPSF